MEALRTELQKKDEQLSFLKWELIKADGKIDMERTIHQTEVTRLRTQIDELRRTLGTNNIPLPEPATLPSPRST
jgi:hypothetical protein